MKYPSLQLNETSRDMIQVFRGINQGLRIEDGEWAEAVNLCTDDYPVLSTAKGFNVCQKTGLYNVNYKGDMFWIEEISGGRGRLYLNGERTDFILQSYQNDRQFVRIGAYICIFPEKVYFNTTDWEDCGSMEESHVTTGTRNVFLCDKEGKTITIKYKQAEEPTNPVGGDTWMDTTDDIYVLKRFYGSQNSWITVSNTYVKFPVNATTNFKDGQSIKITGFTGASSSHITDDQLKALDGYHVITKISHMPEGDWIVMPGYINYISREWTVTPTGSIRIESLVPEMDYVCECNNRLWGCKYGYTADGIINEMYCSKLGDFKDWRNYSGISTDSWAASCGTPGPWTGCIAYNGNPIFFKENAMHIVYISSTGAHQVVSKETRGVQKGSADTLAVLNDVLYYKSRHGVMAYTGSVPSLISEKLERTNFALYDKCVGCAVDGRYYLHMRCFEPDYAEPMKFLVYDVKTDSWHELYDVIDSMTTDGLTLIATMAGSVMYEKTKRMLTEYGLRIDEAKTKERDAKFKWHAESGNYGFEQPDHKYLSRFNIRLHLEQGSHVEMYIQYDSDGIWHYKGTEARPGLRSVTIPVAPHRCDHAKIKLTGDGQCKIYSITKVTEAGSDM